MKNFDDMGLIEMAKTLGEMGDEMKREELQCICECQDCGSYDYRTKDKSGCPYHNSINHLRTQNAELVKVATLAKIQLNAIANELKSDFNLAHDNMASNACWLAGTIEQTLKSAGEVKP